jgi:hypothetical protein
MVPIMFELTVLLAAFGATFGMLGLNRIPRHHHPVFYSDRFEAVLERQVFHLDRGRRREVRPGRDTGIPRGARAQPSRAA